MVTLFALLFVSSVFNPLSHAEDRLIDLGQGQRRWMSEAEIADYARSQHRRGRCGNFMDVTDSADSPSEPLRLFSAFYADREIRQSSLILPLLGELSAASMTESIRMLSAFNNRFYKAPSGRDAAIRIRDEFLKLARARTDVKVELFEHEFTQPSVIVTLAGNGPLRDELVILGGHEDSISWGSTQLPADARAPGADDNASGVATILEVFRVLMLADFRPNRTVQFMTYAGEESGLKGSQAIARAWQKDGRIVVGVMQLDMTMHPGPKPAITLTADFVDQDLNRFTGRLIDSYVKIPWNTEACGYACSDHASWSRAGYASTFPFESLLSDENPNIHSKFDTLETLDAAFGLHFARLGLGFLVESAMD